MYTWAHIVIRDLMKAAEEAGRKERENRATKRSWKMAIAEAQRNGGSCFRLVCNIRGGEGFMGAVQCKKLCKSSAMVCGWFLRERERRRSLNFFTQSCFCSIQRYYTYYIYINIYYMAHLSVHIRPCKLAASMPHSLSHKEKKKAVTCLMTFIIEFFFLSALAHWCVSCVKCSYVGDSGRAKHSRSFIVSPCSFLLWHIHGSHCA